MKLFSYLLVTDGHMPSEIMNSTQLLTLTMALRLKTNCSSTNICQNREQELCQHWSVSWWRGSCLRLSRATYYQTWRHLSGANTTMTLYQAYCEGDPDQSSFTASTDSHKAISTRVEIWAKEGKKECSHYRKQMRLCMWWTLAGAHRNRCHLVPAKTGSGGTFHANPSSQCFN